MNRTISKRSVNVFAWWAALWVSVALASPLMGAEASVEGPDDAAANALTEPLVDAVANAVMLQRTFPDIPAATDAATAYEIQASVVDGVYGMQIVGYKAGLTSTAAQRQFGVSQPVLGVLPEPGRVASKATLERVTGLAIEVEIGFLVGIDDQPAAMLPVIELPRLAYADMKKVTLADLIATNVAAYRFITGPTAMIDADVRTYPVSLDRDGTQLFTSFASDASGDPYDIYGWMVTRIHSLGYRLEPGMILITGALGHVVDAEAGHYVAHFGPLGELTFTIGDKHAIQTAR